MHSYAAATWRSTAARPRTALAVPCGVVPPMAPILGGRWRLLCWHSTRDSVRCLVLALVPVGHRHGRAMALASPSREEPPRSSCLWAVRTRQVAWRMATECAVKVARAATLSGTHTLPIDAQELAKVTLNTMVAGNPVPTAPPEWYVAACGAVHATQCRLLPARRHRSAMAHARAGGQPVRNTRCSKRLHE